MDTSTEVGGCRRTTAMFSSDDDDRGHLAPGGRASMVGAGSDSDEEPLSYDDQIRQAVQFTAAFFFFDFFLIPGVCGLINSSKYSMEYPNLSAKMKKDGRVLLAMTLIGSLVFWVGGGVAVLLAKLYSARQGLRFIMMEGREDLDAYEYELSQKEGGVVRLSDLNRGTGARATPSRRGDDYYTGPEERDVEASPASMIYRSPGTGRGGDRGDRAGVSPVRSTHRDEDGGHFYDSGSDVSELQLQEDKRDTRGG